MVPRQLGHRDSVMALRVYGRFAPRGVEWDYWREKVSQHQEEKWGIHGTAHGTGDNQRNKSPAYEEPLTVAEGESYTDGRGGTRTRDPGIMSAVL